MEDIYTVQQIRQRIMERYRSDPHIRVNVSLSRPKLHLNDVAAKITGVYSHIFQVEETTSGEVKRHILQYTDVLLHNIEILGL